MKKLTKGQRIRIRQQYPLLGEPVQTYSATFFYYINSRTARVVAAGGGLTVPVRDIVWREGKAG